MEDCWQMWARYKAHLAELEMPEWMRPKIALGQLRDNQGLDWGLNSAIPALAGDDKGGLH